MCKELLVTVKEASEMLGISSLALRLALQQDKFSEFGVAVKHETNYAYYIYRKRLEKYLEGELI